MTVDRHTYKQTDRYADHNTPCSTIWDGVNEQLEGKYSLESTDPCESEIRAPPQPLQYLMPIPPNTLFYNK